MHYYLSILYCCLFIYFLNNVYMCIWYPFLLYICIICDLFKDIAIFASPCLYITGCRCFMYVFIDLLLLVTSCIFSYFFYSFIFLFNLFILLNFILLFFTLIYLLYLHYVFGCYYFLLGHFDCYRIFIVMKLKVSISIWST